MNPIYSLPLIARSRMFILLLGILISSCTHSKHNLPKELKDFPVGIEVVHTPDKVYATDNTKDPGKRGEFQLQHSTSVKALYEDLEITEFGAYLWNKDHWEMKTIYGRPFNANEFSKWYNCENGLLKKGCTYVDSDNWMGKTDKLTGDTIEGLWYFIAKNRENEKSIGYKEITGYLHR